MRFSSIVPVTHIYQPSRYACASTALQMAVNARGGKVKLPVSDGGANDSDMRALAFFAGAMEVYVHNVSDIGQYLLWKGPVVAEVSFPRAGLGHEMASWNHCVVVIGVSDGGDVVYLDPGDPSGREVTEDWYDFLERSRSFWVVD